MRRASRGFGYNRGVASPSRQLNPLNADIRSAGTASRKPRAFALFANGDYRIFLITATAAMMADNIEHVISYWVMFQKFRSPALGAFAVVSHWVPYLFFGAFSGRLADRFDIRRLIQAGMLLFVGVSIGWGIMFMTDTSAVWKVMVLLVIHGLAGVLWIPASQVLIHRIVTLEQLPSAVRIFVTGRYLGFLVGPIVGDALLQIFGASVGICINALIYVPLFVWLLKVPAHAQSAGERPPTQGLSGFADIWATMKVVANNRILSSMTLLVGASAFFIGNAYQAQMPGFAMDLGHARANFSYGVLLGADAAGGLAAGLILEGRGLLPPRARTAFILAMIWCCALFGFARSNTYTVSITLLFVAGFVELAFNAMAQSLVQLNAPGEIRGRVLGVYSMFAMGLRTFSGLSVGLLGSLINIHNSLSSSAAALFLLYVAIFVVRYAGRGENARTLT